MEGFPKHVLRLDGPGPSRHSCDCAPWYVVALLTVMLMAAVQALGFAGYKFWYKPRAELAALHAQIGRFTVLVVNDAATCQQARSPDRLGGSVFLDNGGESCSIFGAVDQVDDEWYTVSVFKRSFSVPVSMAYLSKPIDPWPI